MGIAFSHGNASWSYSGFMTFRTKIVNTIGLPGGLSEAYNDGSYKFLINDPIYAFINHSDCDGDLSVEELKVVAPRLEEIIESWETNHIHNYDIISGKELVESMKRAISNNEKLGFH